MHRFVLTRSISSLAIVTTFGTLCLATALTHAQDKPNPTPPEAAASSRPRENDRPGQMRFPGPMREEIKLVEKFDRNGDKWLNADERKEAREFLKKERAERRLRRGPGGPGGFGGPGAPDGPGGGRRLFLFGPDGQPQPQPPGTPPPAAGAPPQTPGTPAPAPAAGTPPPPNAPPADVLIGPGGPFGPGGFAPGARGFGPRRPQEPAKPGRKVDPKDVANHRAMPFYDPHTLRTFFFEFESNDWEAELADFKNTDVEVPAKLTVDGNTLKDVGVHFRGASSFMMIGEGRKRSLGVSLDYIHEKQDLDSYQTLDLLNSNDDPSFLRAILYYQIARDYIPAPKANFVHVVINGESWGVYVNKQQFNKDFVKEWFGTKKGARWKVPGSPGGGGGLEYLGDDVADYKKRYELKSKDDPKAWESLINLCRVLNETSADKLEEKLTPILNIDGALRFLALENVLVNNDGYWVRASDYSMYQDEKGRFHVIPHDANETFARPHGPGFGGPGMMMRFRRPDGAPGPAPQPAPIAGAPAPAPAPQLDQPPQPPAVGPQTRGVELDPFVSAKDPKKPLLSKLLAVPSLRERYLSYVREIAEKWLDWEKLGPIAQQYHALIAEEVALDTRKLDSTAAFETSVDGADEAAAPNEPPRRRDLSLKAFAEQRRAYLLKYPEIAGSAKNSTRPAQP